MADEELEDDVVLALVGVTVTITRVTWVRVAVVCWFSTTSVEVDKELEVMGSDEDVDTSDEVVDSVLDSELDPELLDSVEDPEVDDSEVEDPELETEEDVVELEGMLLNVVLGTKLDEPCDVSEVVVTSEVTEELLLVRGSVDVCVLLLNDRLESVVDSSARLRMFPLDWSIASCWCRASCSRKGSSRASSGLSHL